MRPQTKAMFSLLLGGVLVAMVRIALSSQFLRGPGAEALSDLLGCVLAAGALFGVIAMRSLAADVDRRQVLDDGVASLALGACLVASLPPRESNYLAVNSTDDFVRAYAPATLIAVTLLLLWAGFKPVTGVLMLVVRHAAILAVVVPLTGLLVFIAAAKSAVDATELNKALVAGGLWGAVCLGAWFRQKSPIP